MAVKETLDERFTRRVESLFQKTIRYILTLIIIGFRQTRRPSSLIDPALTAAALTTSQSPPTTDACSSSATSEV